MTNFTPQQKDVLQHTFELVRDADALAQRFYERLERVLKNKRDVTRTQVW